MTIALSPAQQSARREFWAFAGSRVRPWADQIDREEAIPRSIIDSLIDARYLASGFPAEYGGIHADPVIHGLMHEALGAASASVQGLVNVHHMAGSSIARWGTADQKRAWLP
ncbi:MAG: acyl-CoA dehydrogenase family protein, partial [Myxococcota bacterium]